jgi:uncharacterized membrane protein YcjF (UPF0283 family)
MNDEEQLHWLVRPSTIRKIWIGSSILLALTVLAQTVIYVKGYFGFDAWFGFGAIYGFVSCLVMVLVAKLLGLVLKRPIDYYDKHQHQTTPDTSQNNVKESRNGV